MIKCIVKRLAGWQPIFYQSLPIHSWLCNYCLIDFVNQVFVMNVIVKENSFKWNLQRDKSCYNVESLENCYFRPRWYNT